MQNEWNPPPLAGQPMGISELLDEMALLALPDGSRVVTIEEAREELEKQGIKASIIHQLWLA